MTFKTIKLDHCNQLLLGTIHTVGSHFTYSFNLLAMRIRYYMSIEHPQRNASLDQVNGAQVRDLLSCLTTMHVFGEAIPLVRG